MVVTYMTDPGLWWGNIYTASGAVCTIKNWTAKEIDDSLQLVCSLNPSVKGKVPQVAP